MSLAQLPNSTVKLITSSQIITSVSSAVKELVENSFDAGATSVDVKLVNNGLDRIEVRDNGSGICKSNTACMALPHYTSKISNFSDLESLESYGFRGEALNGLCAVGNVTLTTATSSDPVAMMYTLDSSGNIIGTKPSHHVQGTTVVVSNLFKNLPVRRQLMGSTRRALEELKQVETVVKSLAVIKPNVRVTLYHNKCLIWQKIPCSNLQNSFSQLIGYSTGQNLEQLCFKVTNEIGIEMFVPKKHCDISLLTKSTPALSLVFINQRPVTYKKILKVLQQQLAERFGDKFSTRKFAVCLFSITSSPSNIDVNLEPNKTKVLLKDEEDVLCAVQKQLLAYYSNPNLQNSNLQEVQELARQQLLSKESSIVSDEEVGPRKKRKVEDEHGATEVGSVFENGVISHSILISHNIEDYEVAHSADGKKDKISSVQDHNPKSNENSVSSSYLSEVHTTGKLEEGLLTSQHKEAPLPEKNCLSLDVSTSALVTQRSLSLKNTRPVNENEINRNVNLHKDQYATHHVEESENNGEFSKGVKELNEGLCISDEHANHFSGSPDLENLWDNVDINDLNGLSKCLDAIESRQESPMQVADDELKLPMKKVVSFGPEKWSMGHVATPGGELVKGSCVLVGGISTASAAESSETTISTCQNQAKELDIIEEGIILKARSRTPSPPSKKNLNSTDVFGGLKKLSPPQPRKSPQKCPRAPISGGVSPGLNCSLQSVSSQMGRRELAAFTKFAREVRPQIILENPGIAFTNVASLLAEKWQSLSMEEREHYEEIARETATTRKVWKTFDKQKKLEWVKKLPTKDEKRKLVPDKNKFTRREVPCNIGIDMVKAKSNVASLSVERQHLLSSNMCLLGHLEPSGTWVCLEKVQLSLLNPHRLQEIVINHRLLSTYALVCKSLQPLEKLDSLILGEDAWSTLLSLSCTLNEIRRIRVVTADVILKNGFKIEISEDNTSAFLTEVAEALNYYGIKELKETLALCRTSPNMELSECRPLRVVSHIKSEAMRICRKSPSMLQETMVEELIEYWKTVMKSEDVNCLHSKPILTPVFNLADRTMHAP